MNSIDFVTFIPAAFMVIGTLFSAGCVAVRDVTNEPSMCGGYRKGNIYTLMQDVALTDTRVLSGDRLYINHYINEKQNNASGIVASGTRVILDRIIYKQHPENGASLHPWVTFLNGPWRGQHADIHMLSRYTCKRGEDPYTYYTMEPDPKYLKTMDEVNSMDDLTPE